MRARVGFLLFSPGILGHLRTGTEENHLRRADPQESPDAAARIPNHLFLCGAYSGLSALPEALRENINNTLDVNLAMPYTYFNDAKCLNLLKEYGDDGLEDLFLSSPEGKYRSDICRTVYLYQNGGFYVDLDFELVKPLTNLVDANTSFMSAWTMTGDILNALMGAEPKSAILKRTITLMTRFTDFKPRRPNATRRLPNASLREGLAVAVSRGRDASAHAAAFSSEDEAVLDAQVRDGEESRAPDEAGASSQELVLALTDDPLAAQMLAAAVAAEAAGSDASVHAAAAAAAAGGGDGSVHAAAAAAAAGSSLLDAGATFRVWGPRLLHLGMLHYFYACNVGITDAPTAAKHTADFTACNESVRMYEEIDMQMQMVHVWTRRLRRLSYPILAPDDVYLGINDTAVLNAWRAEDRIHSKFSGLRYGVFSRGNVLVGYSRFHKCKNYGCTENSTTAEAPSTNDTNATLLSANRASL